MKTKIFAVCAVLFMTILISGCVQQDEVGIKTALTEIRVGDMPTDEFDHIWINFSEIRLHSNESGWVNISADESVQPVDLLYLHMNNLNETLGIADIPVGNYTKLWINITNATGLLNETQTMVNFTIPSGTLKIQHLFKLDEGDNMITVDIDLNNSILKYGGGEEYKLLPVISGLEHQHKNKLQFQEHDKNKLKNMVENRKPAIDLVVNGSRGKHISVDIDENITFNATETYDVDGDELKYTWDFDDGNTGEGPVVTHNYSKKGTYQVTLTVSDGKLEDTVKITVTVKQKGEQGNGSG